MPDDLRPFETGDLEHFKIDPDGNLYWKGKKLRAGGWGTAERIAFFTAILIALVTVAAGYPNLKALWLDLTSFQGLSDAKAPSTE